MTGRGETAKLNWPRWQQVLLAVVLAMLAATRLSQLADDAAYRAGLLGPMAIISTSTTSSVDAPRHFYKVIAVEPGGPADRAGFRVGDSIRPDIQAFFNIRQPVGKIRLIERDRAGARSLHRITQEPARLNAAQQQYQKWLALNRLAAFITAAIGCFILWRGWGNSTAMLLGAGMVPLYIGGITIPAWAGGMVASQVFTALTVTLLLLFNALPVFAMRHYEDTVAPLPAWLWRGLKVFLTFSLLSFGLNVLASYSGTVLPVWDTGEGLVRITALLGLLWCLGLLYAAWRRSEGPARNRNALMLFAFAAFFAGAAAGIASFTGSAAMTSSTASPWLHVTSFVMAGLIAPVLMAYAILRHRLFDLGFAVNRTLVFGAIGVLLLVSFALIEWAIKQAIPKVWYGGSVYISAGIAVSLYLLFNRIHHKVEHAIERLFFHKWQLNEQALRRFVRAAAHIEKPEALAGNFVAELVRFTGGAKRAIYARTAEGHYADASGATIDADDPALAAMRAEQGSVVPAELNSSIEAALALPMMHQAALAGFVLLGPKTTGEDYRPDEVEVLGWATQQVGLDLQAIRVRDLELTNLKLVERNHALSEILTGSSLAKT